MPDDIRVKAEVYVDDCIARMSQDRRPSQLQRSNAVAKVEKYTRELATMIRFHSEGPNRDDYAPTH